MIPQHALYILNILVIFYFNLFLLLSSVSLTDDLCCLYMKEKLTKSTAEVQFVS